MASGAKGVPSFCFDLKYRGKTPVFGLKIAKDFRRIKQIKEISLGLL